MSWHKSAAGGRYRARGLEAESEPGSDGRVLRNKLSIRSVRAMEQRESEALHAATQRLIDETDRDHRFTAEDIRHMHHCGWARFIHGPVITDGSILPRGTFRLPRPTRFRDWYADSSRDRCGNLRPAGLQTPQIRRGRWPWCMRN